MSYSDAIAVLLWGDTDACDVAQAWLDSLETGELLEAFDWDALSSDGAEVTS